MNPRSARSIHLWVSILLALPMLIVALTAVLIAHDKSLGLKEIQLPAALLPGGAKSEEAELRAYWSMRPTADAAYLGGKGGLLRQQGGLLTPVDGLQGEVRALLGQADGTLLAAGQRGLYRVQGLQAERLARGDFWTLSRQPDGSLLAIGKDGLALRSGDGQAWSATLAAELRQLAARAPAVETLSLGKLVMDLHTGKALFGKRYEWIWIDVLGVTLALLGFTGLWMWWRSQRRQAQRLAA